MIETIISQYLLFLFKDKFMPVPFACHFMEVYAIL